MESSTTAPKVIQLKNLDNQIEASLANNRYCIFFDKTGNCEVFFRYKATQVEVAKLSIGLTMQSYSQDEVIEKLRKPLVYCMQSGDRVVFFIDKIAPDFKNKFTDPNYFPTDKVFNFNEWRQKENYKKILKEDEDKDVFGNRGFYEMKDNFTLLILATYTDDETMQEIMKNIPNLDNFDIFCVE